jgi:hypothetical protein
MHTQCYVDKHAEERNKLFSTASFSSSDFFRKCLLAHAAEYDKRLRIVLRQTTAGAYIGGVKSREKSGRRT